MQAGRRVDPHYLSSYRDALLAAIHRQLTRPARPQDRQGALGLPRTPFCATCWPLRGALLLAGAGSGVAVVTLKGQQAGMTSTTAAMGVVQGSSPDRALLVQAGLGPVP